APCCCTTSDSLHRTATYIRRTSSVQSRGLSRSPVLTKVPLLTVISRPPAYTETAVIRFRVSVPVLSRQIVCTAPSVSTAARRRMRTPCRRMLRMPRARTVVATVGNPSGTAATAREIAVLSISNAPYPCSSPMPKTRPHTALLSKTSCLPIAPSCCCSGVSGGSAVSTRGDRLTTQLSELTIYVLTFLGPSEGVPTSLRSA